LPVRLWQKRKTDGYLVEGEGRAEGEGIEATRTISMGPPTPNPVGLRDPGWIQYGGQPETTRFGAENLAGPYGSPYGPVLFF
jgi:hypothetical protein